MNYNEFEMIMNKLNVSFLALDLYSDYFSQDFYEESGIYMILDVLWKTTELQFIYLRKIKNLKWKGNVNLWMIMNKFLKY